MNPDFIIMLRFPVNLILTAAYAAIIWTISIFFSRKPLVKYLSSSRFTICVDLFSALVIITGSFFRVDFYYSISFMTLLVVALGQLELLILNEGWKDNLTGCGIWVTLAAYLMSLPDMFANPEAGDPWRPVIIAGFAIMVAGTLSSIRKGRISKYIAIGILTAIVLVMLILLKLNPYIFSGERPTVLKSGWFYPHIGAYILSYSALALSLVLTMASAIREAHHKEYASMLSSADILCQSGSALFLVGMIFGSLWAMQAWGIGWAWDIKESWALATWITYLSLVRLRKRYPQSLKTAAIVSMIAFTLLTMTWLGLKLLPSATESLHLVHK
jgi:hypothetical protein